MVFLLCVCGCLERGCCHSARDHVSLAPSQSRPRASARQYAHAHSGMYTLFLLRKRILCYVLWYGFLTQTNKDKRAAAGFCTLQKRIVELSSILFKFMTKMCFSALWCMLPALPLLRKCLTRIDCLASFGPFFIRIVAVRPKDNVFLCLNDSTHSLPQTLCQRQILLWLLFISLRATVG